ncbi:MAG: hypothetical protein HGA40_03605, partial [Methanoregulaceae archaeon]|nr:hypothetical protein [Methanoregulaceae archaeon]
MLQGITRTGPFEWEVPIGYVGGMRVPGRFFLSDQLAETLEPGAVQQLANVATMPGIVKNSLAMPDIHWGYGFPIGGVAAFGMDEGVISPGGVGFDINCGVRILSTPLSVKDLSKKRELIEDLFTAVPTGVGAKSTLRLEPKELSGMLTSGARWAVEHGYGIEEDIRHCEEQGAMANADPSAVSQKARLRGMPQSGTLGAGNHFLELQVVREIYDLEAARAMLLGLGFVLIFIYDKYRQVLALEDTLIMLDELPFGSFVEIEGPSLQAIGRSAAALGLDWDRRVSPGQKILVCDIGGGTTDFTLIRVRRGEDDKVLF